MVAVPALAIRLAGTVAVNCAALTNTNVVDSKDPFHSTADPFTNPVPFTVRVKADPPAVAELGLRLVMANVPTVKLAPLEVLPPGLATVMVAVPARAVRLAGPAAVNCVALTNVVDSKDPFHSTADPFTNPVPFTVRVKADPPAVAAFGLRLVMVSAP